MKKLNKSLEYIVDSCGFLDKQSIVMIVYMADYFWFLLHNMSHTGATYYRWNNGPYSKDVLKSLIYLDGIEIVSQWQPDGVFYKTGFSTRLKNDILDNQFKSNIDTVIKIWYYSPEEFRNYVYDTFRDYHFGQLLVKGDGNVIADEERRSENKNCN